MANSYSQMYIQIVFAVLGRANVITDGWINYVAAPLLTLFYCCFSYKYDATALLENVFEVLNSCYTIKK
jgi:hypothetical protein